MPGIGPITNTRTLKGALRETIGKLEQARQKPRIVKLLQRCRDYRELVDEWDQVSPPPDEQFETIGEIMQLLGAAMQETKRAAKADPDIEVSTLEPLGEAFHDLEIDEMALGDEDEDDKDVVKHEAVSTHQVLELDLVPASPCAQMVELYREPWRKTESKVRVKHLKSGVGGRLHALVRLAAGDELMGQKHEADECVYVLDGCISHAGEIVHAGAALCFDAGSKSGTIRAMGETTLMFIDSDRRSIRF